MAIYQPRTNQTNQLCQIFAKGGAHLIWNILVIFVSLHVGHYVWPRRRPAVPHHCLKWTTSRCYLGGQTQMQNKWLTAKYQTCSKRPSTQSKVMLLHLLFFPHNSPVCFLFHSNLDREEWIPENLSGSEVSDSTVWVIVHLLLIFCGGVK